MRWFEFCDNPAAITGLYDDPPDLSPFRIESISLYTDLIWIEGDLSRAPDKRAQPHEQDVARLSLMCYSASQLRLENCIPSETVDLSISKRDTRTLHVSIQSRDFSSFFDCGEILIGDCTIFSQEKVQRKKSTLFTYPNVWNSCLLTLRDLGFTCKVMGDRDPDGKESHCHWHATKGHRELKAINPTELLGLAQLSELAHLDNTEDYWWRVDGPNLVEELTAAWRRRWEGPDHSSTT